MLNEFGVSDFLRDSGGGVVLSRLDEPTLSAIARATHGSYHPLGTLGGGALNEVRRLVDTSTGFQDSFRLRKLGVDRFSPASRRGDRGARARILDWHEA